jgi:hypothetical protein
MIDGLHDAGIEVMSPSIRSIRTYPESRAFVPASGHRSTGNAHEGAPIDVVFDKAESAESEERLEEQRDKLDAELKQAREDSRSSEGDEARAGAEQRTESLERRLERLDTKIALRRQEKGSD